MSHGKKCVCVPVAHDVLRASRTAPVRVTQVARCTGSAGSGPPPFSQVPQGPGGGVTARGQAALSSAAWAGRGRVPESQVPVRVP